MWFIYNRDVMAAVVLRRGVIGYFHSDGIRWKSKINSKLVIQYDLQSMRHFSFKLLNEIPKDIKKQLDNVKIHTSLRVSNT
jgi:fibronectin type 3 domain-containing protein